VAHRNWNSKLSTVRIVQLCSVRDGKGQNHETDDFRVSLSKYIQFNRSLLIFYTFNVWKLHIYLHSISWSKFKEGLQSLSNSTHSMTTRICCSVFSTSSHRVGKSTRTLRNRYKKLNSYSMEQNTQKWQIYEEWRAEWKRGVNRRKCDVRFISISMPSETQTL